MNHRHLRTYVGFLMLFTCTRMLFAQTPCSATEAADYVQEKRSEAWRLINNELATPVQIKKGIAILDSTLVFLQEPRILMLANESQYLKYRKADVCSYLAVAYARLGEYDAAIACLRMIASEDMSYPSSWLEKQDAFAPLRDRPDYKDIIKSFETCRSIFNNKALLSEYSTNLTGPEKIAGLTLFWTQIKNNFVYFDHVSDLDWNALYLEYLAKVTETQSTLEYYKLLQKMCAMLRDGHTNIYPPMRLRDSIYARPPLRTALVDGKVVIAQILSDSLLTSGLRLGQEVLSIDGIPVREYAERFVAPYMSSSTPQDLKVRTYTYSLLAGKITKGIRLQLRDSSSILVKDIARSGYGDIKRTPVFEYRRLGRNLAYVALNSFERDTVVSLFNDRFEEILKSDALILDVRLNGGGSGSIGYDILGYLTEKPFSIEQSSYRASENNLTWRQYPAGTWQPHAGKVFTKPVIVLIGNMTFSAAEDFVVAFDAMKRGKMIGEPTGGSTGQPYSFNLPGGLSGRVCSKRCSYPDGKEFVGKGIEPDIRAIPKVADIREGRDIVLERAIEVLSRNQGH